MDIRRRAVALYGRFSAGERDRLKRDITRREGIVARDLTRRSDTLVVGALATALIDCGALGERLRKAKKRNIPVWGERSFAAALAGKQETEAPTLPLATALAPTALTRDDARLLAAFDLIVCDADHCRFNDAGVIRTAADLVEQGRSRADVVRILMRARDQAPSGRHRIVLAPSGGAALQWENGLTTLAGQGFLPLGPSATVDELFEAAELDEASGDHDEAARLYDMCTRADRTDAIAPFNLANIRLAQGAHDEAAMAYRRALARDPDFLEARYNLALALEAAGNTERASDELERVLAIDAAYPDAVFNLAQIRLNSGEIAKAKTLYERYLTLDPPADWAATARKAVAYCTAHLSAYGQAG